MKTFTLILKKNALGSMVKRLRRAVKTGIPDLHPDCIYCDSIDSMLKTITPPRFDVFCAINQNKPKNVTALAKILKRDTESVLKDVTALYFVGIINLKPYKLNPTFSQRPITKYSKIVFECDFSQFRTSQARKLKTNNAKKKKTKTLT